MAASNDNLGFLFVAVLVIRALLFGASTFGGPHIFGSSHIQCGRPTERMDIGGHMGILYGSYSKVA